MNQTIASEQVAEAEQASSYDWHQIRSVSLKEQRVLDLLHEVRPILLQLVQDADPDLLKQPVILGLLYGRQAFENNPVLMAMLESLQPTVGYMSYLECLERTAVLSELGTNYRNANESQASSLKDLTFTFSPSMDVVVGVWVSDYEKVRLALNIFERVLTDYLDSVKNNQSPTPRLDEFFRVLLKVASSAQRAYERGRWTCSVAE